MFLGSKVKVYFVKSPAFSLTFDIVALPTKVSSWKVTKMPVDCDELPTYKVKLLVVIAKFAFWIVPTIKSIPIPEFALIVELKVVDTTQVAEL